MTKRVLFVLILFAATGFFTQRIISLWDELSLETPSPDPTLVTFSLLLLVAGFSIMGLSWWLVLRGIGTDHSFVQAFNSFALTQLTKYLPGSVWPVLGRVAVLKGKKSNLLAASAAEMILKATAALAVSLFLIDTSQYVSPWLILTVIGLIAAGTNPRIIAPTIKALNKVLGREGIVTTTIRQEWLAGAMLTSIATWAVIGLGYALFVNAFAQAPIVTLVGAFALAWTIGFFVIPVPAGIGVREAVLVLITTPVLTEPTAIILALAARLWWMTGDLLFFLLGLLTRSSALRKYP